MIYDVVVIGAGPAGAHLSYLLAKSGCKVALVDRAKFPRDKLCGGLLTYKTLKLLEAAYSNADFKGFEVQSAHVIFKNELLASFDLLSHSYIVHRYTFDSELVSHAKDQGCCTYFGVSLNTIDFSQNEVHLSDGKVIKYIQLVGADGVLSKVRRLSGIPHNQSGFCMEAYVPRNQVKDLSRLDKGGIEIYYGNFTKGYGWIFPRKDSILVGAGSITNEANEKEVISLFDKFLHTVTYCKNIKSFGAYIPAGNSIALGTPQHENVCLIGDASGFIDPFTGEGIYYALFTAEIAAKAILSGKSVYNVYKKNLQTNIDIINDNINIRDEIYRPIVLENSIISMQNVSKYSESLIDESILRYSKTYRTAYEEFKFYCR